MNEVSETELDREMAAELAILARDGLKNNPLRLEYERQVRDLPRLRQQLEDQGLPQEQIARTLHQRRRELGRRFKEAAPPLLREYIYYATWQKYGDPLGPSYDALRRRKTDGEIIASAARPIENLDRRLTVAGFQTWYAQVKRKNL